MHINDLPPEACLDILLVESDFFVDDSHVVIQRLSRPDPLHDVSLEE